MFDKYYSNTHSKEYVPYDKTVTINENRAATDESIKIYGEMLDKARQSLFDDFTCTSALIGEVQVQVHNDLHRIVDYNIGYRFLLNNEVIQDVIPFKLKDEYYCDKSRYDIINEVVDAIGKQVAKKIGDSIVKGMIDNYSFREELFKR